MISSAGNSVYPRDVRAVPARSSLWSIFTTSPPPAWDQPRAEIPKLAVDVDAFLKVNAADTTLILSLHGETDALYRAFSPISHKEQIIRCVKECFHISITSARTWSCGDSALSGSGGLQNRSNSCLFCWFAQFITFSSIVCAATILLIEYKLAHLAELLVHLHLWREVKIDLGSHFI